MKRSNKKGFTLVELIVVGTMMVIILGAILNLIEPINNFYKNVQTTANSNDIGNLTMKYLESELRYSTEILILEDFEGVPVVKDGYIQRNDDTDMYCQYTDCIIVENNPEVVRGNINGAIAGDVGDPIVARRKSAFGQIYRVHLDESTGMLDPNDIRIALGEDVYDDFSYQFTIRGPQAVNTTNKVVDVKMDVFKPEYDAKTTDPNTGSHYIYNLNKPMFSQQRSLELLNINQIKGSYVMYYFSDSPDVDDVLPIPNDIKKSTTPAVEDWMDSLYSGNVPHTFIFYRKDPDPTASSSTTVTVRLDTGDSFTLNKGDIIPDTYGKFPDPTDSTTWNAASWYKKSLGGTVTGADGKLYQKQIAEIIDDSINKTLQDYIADGTPVNQDINFRIVWGYVLKATPTGSLSFYNTEDDYIDGKKPPIIFYTYEDPNEWGGRTGMDSSDFPDEPVTVARDKEFEYWLEGPFGTAAASHYDNSTDYVFYPKLKNKPSVYYVFKDTDGSTIKTLKDVRDDYLFLKDDTDAIIDPADYPDYSAPSGEQMVYWEQTSVSDSKYPQKFPKKGGVLTPTTYDFLTGSSSIPLIFEPHLIPENQAFNSAAIIGSGYNDSRSADREIVIANTGDIDSEGEIVITISLGADIESAHASGSSIIEQGCPRDGTSYDTRTYIIKYDGTIAKNSQITIPITFTMVSEYDFSNMRIKVTTPPPPEPEDDDESSEEESSEEEPEDESSEDEDEE